MAFQSLWEEEEIGAIVLGLQTEAFSTVYHSFCYVFATSKFKRTV
jgi:hypothetical protein